MKKISVMIQNRNTLILEEDAHKGDYIDLSTLTNVDFSTIETLIIEGKDKVYENKLKEYQKNLELESSINLSKIEKDYQDKINELNTIIKELTSQNETNIKIKELEIKNEFQKQIDALNKQIEVLKENNETQLQLKIAEVNQSFLKEKSILENQISQYDLAKKLEIDSLKNNQTLEISKINASYDKKLQEISLQNELNLKNKDLDFELKYQKLKDNYLEEIQLKNDIIKEKEDAILTLTRQKSSLNVKQTGEDLEAWCDREMISYMQNGLLNCTWYKDNTVIKNEGEIKGSKADFIFKVYASEKHLEEEEITSVCLDMKDENPDSVNKKKNSDYYKDLDKNRLKKNCKYAVLVSNLELDKPNDLPIYKVTEYEDMYVVRPAYMMTLLNVIASLSKRFVDLILAQTNEKIELKNLNDLKEAFDSLKQTYLDNPLAKLRKDIEAIRKNNEAILKASKNIDDICDSITRGYMNQIEEKLNKFNLKMEKEYDKFNKKESLIVAK